MHKTTHITTIAQLPCAIVQQRRHVWKDRSWPQDCTNTIFVSTTLKVDHNLNTRHTFQFTHWTI